VMGMWWTLPVRADGDVFLLSQVRGEECCDVGSVEHLRGQITAINQYNYPAHFLWRYDALQNEKMLDVWRQAGNVSLEPGLWVEVTPSVATAAGVVYRGDESNWYTAEHSLLVGYEPDERRRLLDVMLTQFGQTFGRAPRLAGAWGIDSESLVYLHERGVQVWMSVREQSGTDSYTNIGGPTHYPYFAARSWYLVPSGDPEDMLVIKHTIADPYHNYGDTTSGFTSQPNDYARVDLNTTDYFASLFRQAMTQDERGWAVVGLENSMGAEYQTEFTKQLEQVHEYQKNTAEDIQVVNIDQVLARWRAEPSRVHVLVGRDFVADPQEKVYWIETKRYRLRLIMTAVGLVLDDVRVYDENFEDYYNHQVAQNGLYQIVPAVMDGALVRARPAGVEEWDYYTVAPDVPARRGWRWPEVEGEIGVEQERERVALSYTTPGGETVRLEFGEQSWTSNVVPQELTDEEGALAQTWAATDYPVAMETSKGETWQVTYVSRPELLAAARQKYRSVLAPEIRRAVPDVTTSRAVVTNNYARRGGAPVRLTLLAADGDYFPVWPEKVTVTSDAKEVVIQQWRTNGLEQFYDIMAERPGKYVVKVAIDGQEIARVKVYIVEDCQAEWRQCWWRPHWWWRYAWWKWQER